MESNSELDDAHGLSVIKHENHSLLFKSKTLTPISIQDVIHVTEDSLTHTVRATSFAHSIEDIEAFYSEDLKYGISKHAASETKSALQIHYPLHVAARDGNCEEIVQLVNDGFGYNVNQKDLRSITPLHVAALFGQSDAVETLISLGATVDIKGYEEHTPLHFALAKGHYDLALMLVADHHADPLQQDSNGINGFTLLFDAFPELLSTMQLDSTAESKFNQAIDLAAAMIAQSNGPLLYNDISEVNHEMYLTPYPASFILQWIVSYAPTQASADKIMELAQLAQEQDSSSQSFNHAKDLLHRFPTGEIYKISLSSDKDIWFMSEGHSGKHTTDLATLSLQAFRTSDHFDVNDTLKVDIFASLQEVYNNANIFTQYSSTPETATRAHELYNAGQTVLLPSGWDGHFIDVILSKDQAFYVVANSGDRYHGEAPTYNADAAGINFYQIYDTDKIDAQFMHNILNNTDRAALEIENAYEYGVFEKIEEISRDTQQYGNCGWESHRDAVEGLIYIELLNRDMNSEQAKVLASEYYQEWDNFHGDFVIDRYISDNPALPIEALFDIFNQLHLKEDYSVTDHNHAQKIAELLVSPHYVSAFQSWIKDADGTHDLADKLMLNILKQEHGIDISCVLQEGAQCTSHTPEVLTVAAECVVMEPTLYIELPPVHLEFV